MKFSENKLCIKLVFYLHEIWYRVSNRSLQISQSYARKNTVHTSIFFFLVSEFVLVQHLVTNPGINKVEIICDLFVVFLLNLLARWRFCCVAQTRRRVSYCGETFNEAAGQNLRSVCVLFELRSAFWLTGTSFFGILLFFLRFIAQKISEIHTVTKKIRNCSFNHFALVSPRRASDREYTVLGSYEYSSEKQVQRKNTAAVG